jgi:hypothetical protein
MANEQVITLFTKQNASANGVSASWPGGDGVFSAYGTFASGICSLQYTLDAGTTWINVDRSGDTFVTLSASGGGLFSLPPCSIRAVLASATSTTSITAQAQTSRSN